MIGLVFVVKAPTGVVFNGGHGLVRVGTHFSRPNTGDNDDNDDNAKSKIGYLFILII